MNFGINFFPSFRAEDSTTADYYAQCLRLAERADALGYHSLKTVEHSFFDYGGHSPNPCVFLSAIAARTKRVRLTTGAVIPAFHHPAHLGGDLAMLDNMSRGRLDAGFGRAFLPKEFEVYGVPMEESRPRFEEAIGMIRRLWTEERVSQKGKFWTLDDVRLMPRVVQKPHPPIWIAAISSEESFLYAAKNGFHLMIVPYAGKPGLLQEYVKLYRKVWAESGHQAGAEQIQVAQFCYVAEKLDGSAKRLRAHLPALPRDLRRSLHRVAGQVLRPVSRLRQDGGEHHRHHAGEDRGEAAARSSARRTKSRRRCKAASTPSAASSRRCRSTSAAPPTHDAFRTLELFASEVMPRFRG